MALGSFVNMGILPTDPRKKKLPSGGSIKAGQSKDTSMLITGDPRSGGVGFASPLASPISKTTTSDPRMPEYYRPKTEQEFAERKLAAGVAPTHDNMGELAVQYRANADAAHARGEMSVADQKAAKILDARAASDYQINVLRPQEQAMAAANAQAAAKSAYLNQYKNKAQARLASTTSTLANRSGGMSGTSRLLTVRSNQPSVGSVEKAKKQWKGDIRSGSEQGVYGIPWMGGPGGPRATDLTKKDQDPSQGIGIRQMGEHAQAPYRQTLSTRQKMTAGQGAAPGGMGGAMFGTYGTGVR